ncbi:C-type lectin domain family 4 member E-like isoform X2 [Eumetopias jubatus]|uniref:C-type lectin domain family 4 member E-like isoform X2 n=1 Tax=Eumetopias jubatus TaxID=34886 RepID=UPI000F807DE1|nr:C-type lectin domain family 4 member E-like isoform X2 [Eumetopias jubatus]
MNSCQPSISQGTEKRCLSSQVLLWTVAGVSMLLLSACFITRCVVTYRVFQLCDENKFQLHEAFMDFSCSNDGSGSVKNCCPSDWEFLFFAKPKRREFYIGLTDQVNEGQWQWVDGTPLSETLSFWDVGEPNNIVTVEDCATIRDSSNPRKNWNDVPCFFNMFRICEMPEIKVSSNKKIL